MTENKNQTDKPRPPMICFEVRINDGEPVIVGDPEVDVLSAMTNYVARRDELEVRVGGLASRSESQYEHLDWIHQTLAVGDTVVIRVVEANEAADPVSRRRDDPELEERERRRYYEKLKREYEG